MLLVDYADALAIAQLQAAGVTHVGRYVGPASWGKCIGQSEFEALTAAEIGVWLVFEQGTEDYQGGFAAGAANAHLALENLPAGFATDRPIYFAVDTSVSGDALTLAVQYIQGAASVLGVARTGVYGEGALCQACHDQGVAQWFWQSESTSFPGNASTLPITHIQQTVAASPVANTDLDLACKPDFGQCPAPDPSPDPSTQEVFDMSTAVMVGAQEHTAHIDAFGRVIHDWVNAGEPYTEILSGKDGKVADAAGATFGLQSPAVQVIDGALVIWARDSNGNLWRFAQKEGTTTWAAYDFSDAA